METLQIRVTSEVEQRLNLQALFHRALETEMPRVHDMKALREDRPLYEDLYRQTAEVATPYVRTAMDRVTAGNAEALFNQQCTGLQRFLFEEARGATLSDELGPQFARYLEDRLRQIHPSDGLVGELSHEFSRALWDSLLMQMSSHCQSGVVERTDLLPTPDDTASRWQGLFENLAPYALNESEVIEVVRKVFEQLARRPDGDMIRLPLGLQIEKAMLGRVLKGEPEPTRLGHFLEAIRNLV